MLIEAKLKQSPAERFSKVGLHDVWSEVLKDLIHCRSQCTSLLWRKFFAQPPKNRRLAVFFVPFQCVGWTRHMMQGGLVI